MDAARINLAVLKLDAWFETMRGPHGYGGPVVHWWQNCIQFTGAGLDWRYEGIINGYLNLYRRTNNEQWLVKARRAGDDLIRGQLSAGSRRNSCFELNPYTGGTPHEAAGDLALLQLADLLRAQKDEAWEQYALFAESNLQDYHLDRLWDNKLCGFGNSPDNLTFTPNKSATIVEALLALATLRGDESLISKYALPTLDTILRHQILAPNHTLDGAIAQSSLAGQWSAKFFPFYVARCIPVLLKAYTFTRVDRYLNAAQRAITFVLRCRLPDGAFPQVIYGNGHTNHYPQWIAGVGDILRALQLMQETGMDIPKGNTLAWMINGQDSTGGIRTARGFAAQVQQQEPIHPPEFRDILPVCGWVDKAFHYLTSQVQDNLEPLSAGICDMELACMFQGRATRYREDRTVMELWRDGKLIYRYHKGAMWAETCVLGGGI